MMNKSRLKAYYIFSDFLSASLAWFFFNWLRFREIAVVDGFETLLDYLSFLPVWGGQLLVPFFWLTIYYFSGYYNESIGKSRVTEFIQTFTSVLIGVLILFFLIVVNDLPRAFSVFYVLFFSLLFIQFTLTYIFRLCITSYGIRQIKQRKLTENVLIIGIGDRASKLSSKLYDLGYNIVGFVVADKEEEIKVYPELVLGEVKSLDSIMGEVKVDGLVVALDLPDSKKLLDILYPLYRFHLPIKILAESVNVLSRMKVKTLIGVPMVDLTDNNLSYCEENIKHFLDKVVSVGVLIFCSPLFAYLAYRVKKDSPGNVFFRQERLGYMGKPFRIYKFRTMYEGAEANTPQLSELNDSRITPFGRYMRKYRLDELPQFWNVLKGDMSLVGPRPERKYFIDQIVKQAPYYYLMHNVRPGITSLGMVKYGYAKNVEEMIERLAYDVIYYENMSLLFDLKILVYTIKTVITGKGI